MAKNCSVSQNNPVKESNKRRIWRMNPLGNLFRQGVHLSDFWIDPIFIVYSFGKSRPVITEFAYIFIRVSKCDRSNDFGVASVEVNQRHVLKPEKLSFLYMYLPGSEIVYP